MKKGDLVRLSAVGSKLKTHMYVKCREGYGLVTGTEIYCSRLLVTCQWFSASGKPLKWAPFRYNRRELKKFKVVK